MNILCDILPVFEPPVLAMFAISFVSYAPRVVALGICGVRETQASSRLSMFDGEELQSSG